MFLTYYNDCIVSENTKKILESDLFLKSITHDLK